MSIKIIPGAIFKIVPPKKEYRPLFVNPYLVGIGDPTVTALAGMLADGTV